MLVLSRRCEDGVRVALGNGQFATIKVLHIAEHKVRLGITAPREVAILRDELLPLDVIPDRLCDPVGVIEAADRAAMLAIDRRAGTQQE